MIHPKRSQYLHLGFSLGFWPGLALLCSESLAVSVDELPEVWAGLEVSVPVGLGLELAERLAARLGEGLAARLGILLPAWLATGEVAGLGMTESMPSLCMSL